VESGLYIVATPIGNLGDITQRAISVLQAADLIACEDTRHSQRLLAHFQIETPCVAYHEHSGERVAARIRDILSGGGVVALVSDAGTPLISDPGYRLVREVQALAVPVIPLPGPCAAIAALSASGLATDRFSFHGFLPARQGQRAKRLLELQDNAETLVFYEAPHRVLETLQDMLALFGPLREVALAREVTKAFETIRRCSLQELVEFVAADPNQQRGEIVLLLAGCGPREQAIDKPVADLLLRLAEELPAKKAAAVVADVFGLRKKMLYEYLVEARQL
jgi:16S rRNA (cytidine1402-2'-O)-methyltransferase